MAGLIAGVVFGLVVMSHEWLLYGPLNGLVAGVTVGPVFGLVVGFARGLTIGHMAGLVFGFGMLATGVAAALVWGEPVLGLVFAVAGGVPIGIIFVLAVRVIGFTPPRVPAYADLRLRGRIRLLGRKLTTWGGGALVLRFVPGFAAGVLVTVAIALGVGPHQPSGRYLATVVALRVRHQVPLRLLTFLEDAHRLGILRRAGSVYQFRHARLQDRLSRLVPGGDLSDGRGDGCQGTG